MEIEIKYIPKLSFNKYNHLHWAKKKAFKDNIQLLVFASTKERFDGIYNLYFSFTFIGRKLDTINVSHYCKIIEDALFKQDGLNRKISIEVSKGTENKCILNLEKL